MNKDKFIKTCKLELSNAIADRVYSFFNDDRPPLFVLVSPSDPSKVTDAISSKVALSRLLDEDEITADWIKEKFCHEIDKRLSK